MIAALDEALLDNPVHAALTGPHAAFAQMHGTACRYPAEVAPFLGVPADAGEPEWRDAVALLAPADIVATFRTPGSLPPGLQVLQVFPVVQMTAGSSSGVGDPELVELGAGDVPEMLDLVGATNPGPFFPRTVEMGRYLGLRNDGTLVAMAGERLRPPGWTEISAVCTSENHRGQGLGTRLVRAIIDGIERRGERAFLHTTPDNVSAIRLYEELGFTIRRRLTVDVVSLPGTAVFPRR